MATASTLAGDSLGASGLAVDQTHQRRCTHGAADEDRGDDGGDGREQVDPLEVTRHGSSRVRRAARSRPGSSRQAPARLIADVAASEERREQEARRRRRPTPRRGRRTSRYGTGRCRTCAVHGDHGHRRPGRRQQPTRHLGRGSEGGAVGHHQGDAEVRQCAGPLGGRRQGQGLARPGHPRILTWDRRPPDDQDVAAHVVARLVATHGVQHDVEVVPLRVVGSW